MTHVLNIVWQIPWNSSWVNFSCQYRKFRSRFTFFTSCKAEWWSGTVRSQQMMLFPPIYSPAAGPKQPHVWNCAICTGLTRRISRVVRKWATMWDWCGDWDALRHESLPRESLGLTQCDPVSGTAFLSVLPSPALPCPSLPTPSLRSQSYDWVSQDLPKERFPAFQEMSINVWRETLCSSHTAEIVLVQRQVINSDPKECQLQVSLRQ